MTHTRGEQKIIDINYDSIIHETKEAVLFDFDEKEVWLPRSWIELDKKDRVITLEERRAIEKEIEGYAI